MQVRTEQDSRRETTGSIPYRYDWAALGHVSRPGVPPARDHWASVSEPPCRRGSFHGQLVRVAVTWEEPSLSTVCTSAILPGLVKGTDERLEDGLFTAECGNTH